MTMATKKNAHFVCHHDTKTESSAGYIVAMSAIPQKVRWKTVATKMHCGIPNNPSSIKNASVIFVAGGKRVDDKISKINSIISKKIKKA